MDVALARKVVAELVGTAFLVAVVVGSGIFAERLSDDVGLQLLESSIATAGGLLALILAFGSVSGAHFNPVVSLADRIFGGLATRELFAYISAQVVGAGLGAVVANLMFDLDPVTFSTHARSSGGLWLGPPSTSSFPTRPTPPEADTVPRPLQTECRSRSRFASTEREAFGAQIAIAPTFRLLPA